MAEAPDQRTHWNAYAARWALVGEPLRPGKADTSYIRDSVERLLARQNATERALLLGVTPEIAELDWRSPFDLLAVDKSVGMVKAVWPGDTESRRAVVGDWLTLEAPDGGFALVVGDGVFSILDYPAGYRSLAVALTRVLRAGGLLSLRLFCRPEPCERAADVFEQLAAGRIGSFHVFKWRLAMALQGEATDGVRLDDIWQTFSAHVGSFAELAARTGWPEAEIANIESYRDVQERYSFSTAGEVVATLEPDFDLLETWYPDYELGERCPHLSFRRRPLNEEQS
jgi:hypothetical protein